MFGYIKPYKPEMKIKDFELYKSVYCSLCKCMGKKTGVISRLFLSYDATFLALITMAFKKECKGIKKGKCVVNPFKKCNFFISGEDKLAFAASVSSIMMYYKVLDDIKDSKGFKKLLAMVLFPIVKFSYSKSEKLYPEVKKIVYEGMQNQAEIENVNSSSIDESADPTARMMGKILPFLCEDEKQKKVLSQFGYFLGRWIYLIDALDDMEKDIKNKNFNPFVNIINEKNLSIKEAKNYAIEVLNQTLANVMLSFNLLELYNFKDILENIVMLGLKDVQEKIEGGGEKYGSI